MKSKQRTLILLNMSAAEDSEDSTTESYFEDASAVLSIFYGLFIVVLAIVFKLSESIFSEKNEFVFQSNISKTYLCVLFSVGLLWLISFKIHSLWRFRKKTQTIVKSPHASNRWLKAVVAIFGFSIVVKESLEIIAVTQIHNERCEDKFIYVTSSILQAFFVSGQVVFLFFYAKIHIQEFTHVSRFGIMHVMASNLAVWIGVITKETNHALAYEQLHHHHTSNNEKLTMALKKLKDLERIAQINCTSMDSVIPTFSGALDEHGAKEDFTEGLFKGTCFCHSSVCSLVMRADQLLSPMLIEFCLVASCLLYITWSNVGKTITCQPIISKPSYKFYKSYKGVTMGTIVLLGCVIVMILVGSLDSGIPSNEKSYSTEYQFLVIHDGYLALCNCLILIACISGFYVFAKSPFQRRKEFKAKLDVVLLIICLVGPLLVGLFSILSWSAGPPDSKKPRWTISLVYAISDIIGNIVQILLIMHGFSLEHSMHSLSNPKNCQQPCNAADRNSNNEEDFSETNRPIIQAGNHDSKQAEVAELETFEVDDKRNKVLSDNEFDNDANLPVISFSDLMEPEASSNELQSSNRLQVTPYSKRFRSSRAVNPFIKPPAPRKTRLILRDIVMFLVFSNTCLWILFSFNGTAFKIYSYQREYFGHSVWTTLSSVTAPLSIFLKLHSAACFFEIWSYT